MMLAGIWFFLWVLLWAVFFITDGADLGIAVMLPFIGRSERRKKVIYNTMGPLWDGNEVWLITAGGVTFAAFPAVYAVMFSTLYTPLMIILFSLIFRGVALEFRGRAPGKRWKRTWDFLLVAGSLVPSLLFGIVFANIFSGIPFDSGGIFHGSLFSLINIYGLSGGLLFLLLFLVHGAIWLSLKSAGEVSAEAKAVAGRLWYLLLSSAVVFLAFSWKATAVYDGYLKRPGLFALIAVTVVALVSIRPLLGRSMWKAWIASAVTITGATFFGFAGLFPVIFPSSIDPGASLDIFNSSSTPLTLKIMLVIALILVPVVIGYQVWAYRLFREKIGGDEYDEWH